MIRVFQSSNSGATSSGEDPSGRKMEENVLVNQTINHSNESIIDGPTSNKDSSKKKLKIFRIEFER